MERAHNTSMRRMLDSVAWELREYQGDEGNVESCTYEVKPIKKLDDSKMFFAVPEFLQTTVS